MTQYIKQILFEKKVTLMIPVTGKTDCRVLNLQNLIFLAFKYDV